MPLDRNAPITTPAYDRRIAVEDIVAMHLYHGQSIQYIIDSYNLAPVQVYAALTYYYDHRAEIDQSLSNGVLLYESEIDVDSCRAHAG